MPPIENGGGIIKLTSLFKRHGGIAFNKIFFFQSKSTDIFLISPQKHMLWYSLGAPWRNKKNIYLKPALVQTYVVENLLGVSSLFKLTVIVQPSRSIIFIHLFLGASNTFSNILTFTSIFLLLSNFSIWNKKNSYRVKNLPYV